MISLSRLIAGILLILLGGGLIVASFLTSLVFLVYAVPAIVVGIWLLFNKNEDKIEQRADLKGGRKNGK